MTDYLIKTDGTSSGLTLGSDISDTDAFEVQQSFSAPASTLHQTFAAIWTWILSKISANASTVRANAGSWAKLWKPYKTGTYHYPFGYNIAPSSGSPAGANTLLLFPVIFPADVTISDLWVRVSTGAAGNWQAAIYNADQSTFHPTTLIAKSSASASTSSSNTVVAAGGLDTNASLSEGVLYYFAFNASTVSPTFHILSAAGSLFGLSSLLGTTTLANVDQITSQFVPGYSIASVSLGTWDDLTAATLVETVSSGGFPLVGFKVA
ncbi:hypothetical protein [Bradyrhizobium japonicum]|uniref:hypothetical protein n=1 Tax=Bradyrhizobium japonicum TaxID=375 RepID=UPI000462A38C|nr:hypothetical protein [Bradyrhizobium japonicum]